MAPPVKIDFNAVMSDLSQFQEQIGKIHSGLTNPKQKEVLGEALQRVREARADVERTYKPTIQKIEDSARDSQQRAATLKTQAESLQQEYEQKAKEQQEKKQKKKQRRAQAMKKPKAPKLAAQPLSLHAAPQLRDELLSRFQSKPAGQSAPADKSQREIWDDWNWDNHGA